MRPTSSVTTTFHEYTRFDAPGKFGNWKNFGGEIKRDEVRNEHCWFINKIRRTFKDLQYPNVHVRVLVRIRATYGQPETLIVKHAGGKTAVEGVPTGRHNLYDIPTVHLDDLGSLYLTLAFKSGRDMSIYSLEIVVPWTRSRVHSHKYVKHLL